MRLHEHFLGLDTEEKIKRFIEEKELKKKGVDYQVNIINGKEEYEFESHVYIQTIRSDPNHKHHQRLIGAEVTLMNILTMLKK
jgi:hypothetical protein